MTKFIKKFITLSLLTITLQAPAQVTIEMVKDINPGTGDSNPIWLTELNGKMYFGAASNIDGYELWVTDGTAAGTQMLQPPLAPFVNPLASTYELVVFDGSLYFQANYTTDGYELYKLTDASLAVVEQESIETKIYPNPVKDILHISSENPIQALSVYDLTGRLLINNPKINNAQFHVSALAKGAYLLQIQYQNGEIRTIKF